jgi:hypothetical protein
MPLKVLQSQDAALTPMRAVDVKQRYNDRVAEAVKRLERFASDQRCELAPI